LKNSILPEYLQNLDYCIDIFADNLFDFNQDIFDTFYLQEQTENEIGYYFEYPLMDTYAKELFEEL
jgi:hypothetical protein